jgi:group II intron reverse transcriptase/maturase
MNYGKNIGGRGFVVPYTMGRGLWTRAGLNKVRGEECLTDSIDEFPGNVSHKGEHILYNLWWKNKNDKNHINYKLMSILKHDDIWIESYAKLLGNRGSTTAGPDGRTIAELTFDTVNAIKGKVLNGTFEWGEIRRVYIPKPNGGKRPLGIPNISDRLVQEVLRRVLSCIYEPNFSPYSHGFRPGRSCHTALRNVRKSFKGTKWMIEGDISKFFDRVDHTKLISILKKKIRDERILNLIYAGCKCKVIMPESGSIKNEYGVPQGGVLSPLLSNIYLNELDTFMEREMIDGNVGFQRPHSPEYRLYVKKHGLRRARKTELRPTDNMSKSYKRMSYVRYADDFIIGMCDTKTVAVELKTKLANFLKEDLKLELNEGKTIVNDLVQKKKPTRFLGYAIYMHHGIWKRNSNNTLRLYGKGHVRLMVDRNRVVERLAEKGFCTKSGDPRPKFTYLYDSQSNTNTKVNRIFRGIMEYYKLGENRRQVGCELFYILSHSLAKLYAAKFRWHRIATIFKMGGRDLGGKIKIKRSILGNINSGRIDPIIYSHYKDIAQAIKAPLDPNFQATWEEIYKGANQKAISTIEDILRKNTIAGPITTRGDRCSNCGATEELNMHHIKGLKDVQNKSKLSQIKSKSARKTVILCRDCHIKAHGGSFKPSKS